MTRIVIGGVPEHFNLPWALAVEQHVFRTLGVTLEWREFPEGTGAMMRAVEAKDVDIALVLTEGAVAHIAARQTCGIVGTWVGSPLVWGIHSGPRTNKGPSYPHDARIGISRMGSGSHLMPLVHAQREGYKEAPKLVEIATLAGAIEAFADDRIDTFYWERTMTLPQVRAGQMQLDGDFQAAWPAFVAVRARESRPEVDTLWAQVVLTMQRFMEQLLEAVVPFLKEVGERFDLPPEEVKAWYLRTEWDLSLEVDVAALVRAGDALVAAGVLDAAPDPTALIASPGAPRR